jgi:hypothetical protein
MELWTRGLTRSPYYIPLYLLVIPSIFWIVVRSIGVPTKHLVAAGWLFQVDTVSSPSALVAGWNYWTLFDFVSGLLQCPLLFSERKTIYSEASGMVGAQECHSEPCFIGRYWVCVY